METRIKLISLKDVGNDVLGSQISKLSGVIQPNIQQTPHEAVRPINSALIMRFKLSTFRTFLSVHMKTSVVPRLFLLGTT
jgi:hypothetical protein